MDLSLEQHDENAPGTAGPGDRAPISETFVSVQGEGILTGMPSWFCRLSGCNLRCVWCDTPYASWEPESELRSIEDLLTEARGSGMRHAVLTGGEPMLFSQLAPLATGLRDAGFHITIETAGTIDRGDVPFDLMSISPKLTNSTPHGDSRDPNGAWAARHEARRLNMDALNALIARAKQCAGSDTSDIHSNTLQLKFVVTGPSDLAEIEGLLNQLEGWAPGDIQLMPEGTSTPHPDHIAWVVQACLDRGWRYAHRLHIELFGDRRGT